MTTKKMLVSTKKTIALLKGNIDYIDQQCEHTISVIKETSEETNDCYRTIKRNKVHQASLSDRLNKLHEEKTLYLKALSDYL